MSLESLENSTFSDLEISSKIQQKVDSDAEEITLLTDKITSMERNYLQMERVYAEKIKLLYKSLADKDQEFRRLSDELLEMKRLGSEHKKKVESLTSFNKNKNYDKRVKSKSPTLKAPKDNASHPTLNAETERKNSPKNETKKSSPSSKCTYKRQMFQKTALNTADSATVKKNTSSERFTKKSVSPKTSNEKKQAISIKISEVDSIKLVKKGSKGLGSFKEQVPTFK